MKYKFNDYTEAVIAEGYVSITIVDTEAEIDADNAEQVALAERYGGKPTPEKAAVKKESKFGGKSGENSAEEA